jgi:hypothetical protein
MAGEPGATKFEQEIEEIENRRGIRNLFVVLGGLVTVILLVIVVVGARERARLAAEAARPKFEEVVLGRFVGQASNQAVFAEGQRLNYVEGIGQAEMGSTTRFVRHLEYDLAGNPVPAPPGVFFWSLESADSLPYVIEPVTNPLTGVNPGDFRHLDLSGMRAADYGAGGPRDWGLLQEEGTQVSVTGTATRIDDALYVVAEPSRVRIQGVEGLSALDSLEVVWATESGAPLSAFGRISSTPRGGDAALFVLTATAVQPAESGGTAEEGGPAEPSEPTAP